MCILARTIPKETDKKKQAREQSSFACDCFGKSICPRQDRRDRSLLDDQHYQRQHNKDGGGDLCAQRELGFKGLGLGLAEVAVGLAGDGADAAFFRRLQKHGNDHKKRCDDQHDGNNSSHKNKPPR